MSGSVGGADSPVLNRNHEKRTHQVRRPGLDPGSRFLESLDQVAEIAPIRIVLLDQRELPFAPPAHCRFSIRDGQR